MRLGFHGSRTLSDERVRIIVLEEIDRHNPDHIVTHAEPEGVCAVVRKVAQEQGIPLVLHSLNFKFRRGAFEHRSKGVLQDSDYSIFIHDGKSKGTNNEIKLCEKMGLPSSTHTLEITKYKASVGFEIDKEWELETEDQLEQILSGPGIL